MLPEEAQALMAKVLLVVFGTVMLCISKVRAQDISPIAIRIIQEKDRTSPF
mgnify:CR=1 FL=1|tara:strand:+ start:922 stop:1074 length:153 start_codon:yes stop_codon:yes gene_type:complete